MRNLELLCCVLCLCCALSALAGSPYTTHGITVDGRVITALPNVPRPWAHDIIKLVTAELPASERARRHEGQGLFRVILDSDKGTVQRVVIVKSSGYSAIDQTIVGTLRQWRLRPHTWKEFEVYVGLWLKAHGSNQAMQPTTSRRTARAYSDNMTTDDRPGTLLGSSDG